LSAEPVQAVEDLPQPKTDTVQATEESIQGVEESKPDTITYKLGRGDIIEVLVWKEPELTRQMAIRIDGKVSLPLIGDVTAAGKTCMEMGNDLTEKFGKIIDGPTVSVMLIQSKSWKYYMIGQINQPGEFFMEAPLTILQALARSGGFSEWAKKSKITVIRRIDGEEKILSFDYDTLLQGDFSQNMQIMPDDTIIVP